MKYIVAPGRSVITRSPSNPKEGRITLNAGCIISEGQIAEQEAENLVRMGILIRHRPDDVSTMKLPQKAKSPGKWNRNPSDLFGKTIDELNVLIGEIDPKAPLAGSVEEALEMLSMEFDPNTDPAIQNAKTGGVNWKGSPIQLTNGNVPGAEVKAANLTEADSQPASDSE